MEFGPINILGGLVGILLIGVVILYDRVRDLEQRLSILNRRTAHLIEPLASPAKSLAVASAHQDHSQG